MDWVAEYEVVTIFGSFYISGRYWGYNLNGKMDIFKTTSAKKDAETFYKNMLIEARKIPDLNVGRTRTMLGDVNISLIEGFWQCRFRNHIGTFENLSDAKQAAKTLYFQLVKHV